MPSLTDLSALSSASSVTQTSANYNVISSVLTLLGWQDKHSEITQANEADRVLAETLEADYAQYLALPDQSSIDSLKISLNAVIDKLEKDRATATRLALEVSDRLNQETEDHSNNGMAAFVGGLRTKFKTFFGSDDVALMEHYEQLATKYSAQLQELSHLRDNLQASAVELETVEEHSSDQHHLLQTEIGTTQFGFTQQNPVSRKLLISPQGAEFVVNSYTTGDQSFPTVAASSNGSFIITWTSNGQDGSGNGVYGQGYNASAVRLGSEFRVNTYTSSEQSQAAINIAQDGSAYITWGSNQDTNSMTMNNPCILPSLCHFIYCNTNPHDHNYYQDLASCTPGPIEQVGAGIPYSLNMNQISFGVYYNRFSNNIALGVESQVNSQGINNQQNPSLATLPNGDVLMVWESSGSLSYSKSCTTTAMATSSCPVSLTDTFTATTAAQDGSGFGIFGRRFSPFGYYGPDFQINTFSTGDQQLPVVAAYNDSGSVIVWQSQAQDSSGWGVFGRRLTSAGAALGNEFSVNSYITGDQINPVVATTLSNQFVVVWQSAAQDGSGYGIYGRLFDASANPGSEFRVNTYTPNDQINPAVATLKTGEFIVVWQSAGQDGSGYGIYGQRFSADSLPFGTEFPLNTYTSGDQANPSIATFTDGGFIATWDSALQDGAGKAVVARFYENNQLPSLQSGQLTIMEGGTTTITPLVFNITGDHPVTQLKLIIGNLQHGQFQISPQNNSVLQFSQQDILNGQVQFVHDGNEFAPNFTLSTSDGFFTLNAGVPNISYIPVNDPPNITVNRLKITQCQTVYFNTSNLQATDPDSPLGSLTFSITNLQFGVFKSIPRGNISVTSFLQSNITAGDIFFVQDCSASPPYYQVTVDDGEFFVGPQTAVIDLNGLALVTNYLNIAEGQSVTLTASNFNAVATATPTNQIILIASVVQHGQFERIAYPGVAISSFSLQEIQFNAIRFVHDGSEYAPSFNMAVSDGVTTLNPRSTVISYTPVNDPPILVHNKLTVTEGEPVTLNATDLSATDSDSPANDLIFLVTNLQYGHFYSTRNVGTALTAFLQQNVSNGEIFFVSDRLGSEVPQYSIAVSDGQLVTIPQAATIDFTPVNDPPVLINDGLTIDQGGSIILSSSDLSADDKETPADELIFVVGNITHGQFEYVTVSGRAITTFSQGKIGTADMRFVHDGSASAPAYTIKVRDAGGLESDPKPANVRFLSLPQSSQAVEKIDLTKVYSSLSGVGGTLITVLAYLWLRRRIARHRRDFPFVNDLRKVLNLEYYDFTRFDGDTFKTKVDNFLTRLQLEYQQFYTKLTPEEQKSFAVCVAEILMARNLVSRSEYGGGLFGVLCCLNVGWPSQLNMKAFEVQSVEIAVEAMATWRNYAGYKLRPMSDLGEDKQKDTIYVEMEDNVISYTVIDPGVKRGGEQGTIKAEDIGLTTLPVTVNELKAYLPKILKITHERGHTRSDKALKKWPYHSPDMKEKVKVFFCCAKPSTAGMFAPQRRFIPGVELEELKKHQTEDSSLETKSTTGQKGSSDFESRVLSFMGEMGGQMKTMNKKIDALESNPLLVRDRDEEVGFGNS